MEIARRNAAAAGAQVDFRLGNASGMPFEAGAFDLIFCQPAFQNFTEPIDRMMVRWTFEKMPLKSTYCVRDMEAMIAQMPF